METGGLFFKTALNQMFAGLYIEHLCLIGLFFLARDDADGFAAIPEAVLVIVLLVSCILVQIWLNCEFSSSIQEGRADGLHPSLTSQGKRRRTMSIYLHQ